MKLKNENDDNVYIGKLGKIGRKIPGNFRELAHSISIPIYKFLGGQDGMLQEAY